MSTGTNPDESGDRASDIGTALTPSKAGLSGIDPFLAAAAVKEEPVAPRPWHAKLLDYSAHAAMIVGLIGFAWTVSDHVVPHDAPAVALAPVKLSAIDTPAVAAPPAKPQVDEIADLKRANHKLETDIKALHASLDTLRGSLGKTPDQVRALTASVDDMKSGLATTKGETRAEIAQLSGKIEALHREQPSKVTPPAEKIVQRQGPDTTPTGSIPADNGFRAIPTPPSKPSHLVEADDASKDGAAKPQVLAGWVVRDVYDGVAVIEGKRGSMEVVPGVSIPGAGIVKSIDRHGSGWTVTTSKGQLAYAAPAREYRRAQSRDYYQGYRYDF